MIEILARAWTLLQFCGLNLAGWAVFRIKGPRQSSTIGAPLDMEPGCNGVLNVHASCSRWSD
eukprot:scaffold668_cov385-Prasinococcus_capsulatus_cf.AAC.16